MAEFPVAKLSPLEAELTAQDDAFCLVIPLAPFNLADLVVDTRVVLDPIHLPSGELEALAGQRFTFPTNPEEGYIEASVYIEHAHHPVDVTEILFGSVVEERLTARIQARVCVSFEGLFDYEDFDWQLDVTIHKQSVA